MKRITQVCGGLVLLAAALAAALGALCAYGVQLLVPV